MSYDFQQETKKSTANTSEIDILKTLGLLLKKWWVIVISALVLCALGFGMAVYLHIPTYTSTVTFIISNYSDINTSEGKYTSSDITAAQSLSNTFKYILTSDELLEHTITTLDLWDSYPQIQDLKSCISVVPVSNANMLTMSVTTRNSTQSKLIAEQIMNNYKPVLERTLPDSSLNVLNRPKEAAGENANKNKTLFPMIGLLVGAFLSIFILILRDYLKDTISSTREIQNKLALNVVGAVPAIERKRKKKKGDHKSLLITEKRSGFAFIETYKAIRTKMEALSAKRGYKVFVVTSSMENEGKTTVSANLAIALAQNGKSVLLIDGDIRRPALNKILGMKYDNTVGLTSVAEGQESLKESIYYIENYNICVLLSGPSVPEPSEVLSSRQTAEILKAVRNEFDYVIIDSPPVNLVTDATILAGYADASILVIRQDFARYTDIQNAISDLQVSDTELIGCVFNNVDYTKNLYNRYRESRGYYEGYGYTRPGDYGKKRRKN